MARLYLILLDGWVGEVGEWMWVDVGVWMWIGVGK